MANPYPMQPMQPMMQPPMGQQPPMGAGASRGPVVRRGTSKAVPVVVSAGLAIGVFCGLLFGLGVEKDVAVAAPNVTASTPKKAEGDVATPFQPERKDTKVPPLAPQVVPDKGGSGAGTGSGDKAGSGSAVTVPAKPQKVIGKLVIEVLPEGAAKVAKVSVDGAEIEGMSWELDMTELAAKKPDKDKSDVKKEVKIVVKASGYRENQTKIEVVAEKDTTLKIEMVKRSTGGGTGQVQRPQVPVVPNTGGNKPNTGNKTPKCKKPPCGLIDI